MHGAGIVNQEFQINVLNLIKVQNHWRCLVALVNPFIHNVEKWLNIPERACGVNIIFQHYA